MEGLMNKVNIKSAVKFLMAVIVISLSYFALTWATPAWSWSVNSGMTFRISNALRGLALYSPAGAFGVALGGQWANITSGRFFIGLFSILSLGQLVGGLASYWLCARFGKTHRMRIAILAAYGVFMALLVTINKMFFVGAPIMTHHVTFWALFTSKVLTEGSATLCGYPLYLIVRGAKR